MSLSRPGDREPALLSPGFVDRLGICLDHMLQSLEFSVERIPLGLVYAGKFLHGQAFGILICVPVVSFCRDTFHLKLVASQAGITKIAKFPPFFVITVFSHLPMLLPGD